jgi:hypothetical protein
VASNYAAVSGELNFGKVGGPYKPEAARTAGPRTVYGDRAGLRQSAVVKQALELTLLGLAEP